tara:strand:- start:1 stop:1656 length:1656 start_codon:yes stop_codon:yes gene_type:complete
MNTQKHIKKEIQYSLKTHYSVASIILIVSILFGCENNYLSSKKQQTDGDDLKDRPNILLILADDLGYTDVGFFGGEISTPNLDTLANDGIKLTNFHVAPMCFATRAMLMSGMTHPEAGAYKHNDAITNNISILPERLINNGYHTYMAGKWNLGVQAHQGPSIRGFESSYALLPPADNHLGYSNFQDTKEYAAYRENGEAIAMLPKDWFSSELFTDKLIEYIDNKKDDRKPWFGYLAFTAPHLPLQAPDEWIDKYAGQYDLGYDAIRETRNNNATALKIFPENLSLEKYVGKAENWENLSLEDRNISSRAMEIYAAMVENMDFHIGRLIQYLDNESLLDNTLIIFMSDNGAAGSDSSWRPKLIPRSDWDNSLFNMGREGSWTAYGRGWAEAATAPYKDIKGSLHSGGTLSPTFFWHKSIKNQGNYNRSYLTVMDILPTLMDATQIDINDEKSTFASPPIRGRSFWKLIQGDNDAEIDRIRAIPWMTSEKKQALVRWPWKIIRNHDDDPVKDINIENDKWLLFNLKNDPGETNNVSDEYPDIKLELLSAWINV